MVVHVNRLYVTLRTYYRMISLTLFVFLYNIIKDIFFPDIPYGLDHMLDEFHTSLVNHIVDTYSKRKIVNDNFIILFNNVASTNAHLLGH